MKIFLRLAKPMLFFTLIEIALYLAISFMAWEIDATKWHNDLRLLFVFISGAASVFTIIVDYFHRDSKP